VDFRETFRKWLGPEPESTIRAIAKRSGYSLDYLRWAAGLIGQKPWPGSRRFEQKMRELGCSDRPWRERSSEDLARAFQEREVLYSPGEAKQQF
jgi:hypothetical protein